MVDPPNYFDHIKVRHAVRVMMVQAQQQNMLSALNQKKAAITQAMMAAPGDVNAWIDLAKVDNDIIQLEFEMGEEVEIYLTNEKGEFRSETKIYTRCVNNLKTHREKVFGLIMGQCTSSCKTN